MLRYFIIHKPYGMVSQFKSPYDQSLLRDLNFDFPEGTQAVGRLDSDSEGLLILTNDRSLTKRLLHPKNNHLREYLVHVEKKVEEPELRRLNEAMDILIKARGPYTTLPAKVSLIDQPGDLTEAHYKEYYPHTWLHFCLTEGKNRQIRKMCKAVRHECKRLIRTKIEDLELGDLKPGEIKELEQKKLFELLKLSDRD